MTEQLPNAKPKRVRRKEVKKPPTDKPVHVDGYERKPPRKRVKKPVKKKFDNCPGTNFDLVKR